MSKLKIPRPTKWVLVRMKISKSLFVLDRKWFKGLQASGSHMDAEIVAGSNDRDELERFRALTQEV